MRRPHVAPVAAALFLVFAALTSQGALAAQEPAPPSEAEFERFENFDRGRFPDPTTIDNEWLPLVPGTHFVYEGFSVEDGERLEHRIEFTVTDLVKTVDGVPARVGLEKDIVDGLLVEKELAFFGQDADGNVWYFGEYRETYDEMEFVGGRVWLVGYLEGARAGIMMPASPQMGTPSYSQGYAPPPFNWTDRARVYQTGQTATVPSGTYEDVVVTEEFNREEPDAFQLKYYARGVGNVQIGWRGDDTQQEEMGLVEHTQLDPASLAKVREEALELETRAYTYGLTPPAGVREG